VAALVFALAWPQFSQPHVGTRTTASLTATTPRATGTQSHRHRRHAWASHHQFEAAARRRRHLGGGDAPVIAHPVSSVTPPATPDGSANAEFGFER
jgi:hypothetical protein